MVENIKVAAPAHPQKSIWGRANGSPCDADYRGFGSYLPSSAQAPLTFEGSNSYPDEPSTEPMNYGRELQTGTAPRASELSPTLGAGR